ncbi:PilZ domain-containing protein [Roseiarcaceae bacterium H3SJ34-1]|uniref:PilZ domain-containing protein n=1 Tax=Terripilifer ovatus TaxID=3032367 RepID=UPI003AB96099|nr:PilZ domain-containing protein [Roseiarcaceae bacterium H3SJ34-1]
MAEARRAMRVRSMLGAQIVFNNKLSSIECHVRNVSPRGAKLIVGELLSLPQEFELNVPAKGKTYQAHVCWRRGDEVGVEFALDKAQARSYPSDADERIRELESENELLRRKVVDLKAKLERFAELGG